MQPNKQKTSKKHQQTSIDTNIVEVSRKGIRNGPSPKTIENRARKVLVNVGCDKCELSIVLCGDVFIHNLNLEYRNKDSATDVLSFPMNDALKETPSGIMLGDIIISIETAKRQADELHDTLLNEVTSLMIHGILHLLGYTHDTSEKESIMKLKTIELLQLF